MKYLTTPFKKCFDFTGKSSVKEFWFFFIISLLISFFIGGLIGVLKKYSYNIEYLRNVYLFITILPFYSLGFRRLNDAGVNKFLFLIPMVNLILAGLPSDSNE